ncbi:hypothetical protein HYV84_06665 [Candidatus Woesearchaeota archaeon]|nr:hypothetical protein [Candidatus Woesearchaeota archaeon]
MKSKSPISSGIDSIKLADEIKGDLTSEFLKRMNRLKPKVPLVRQSG